MCGAGGLNADQTGISNLAISFVPGLPDLQLAREVVPSDHEVCV